MPFSYNSNERELKTLPIDSSVKSHGFEYNKTINHNKKDFLISICINMLLYVKYCMRISFIHMENTVFYIYISQFFNTKKSRCFIFLRKNEV